MPTRLLVILGAGASYDCASEEVEVDGRYRPPLVTELFESRFSSILHRYPLAEQAAAGIRTAISSGSVAIEEFLRDRLRDSEHDHERRQYWAVPLYLQDLLHEIGMSDQQYGYTAHPDSYDRLLTAALRVDQATFATLNYDDLFDRRFFTYVRRGLKTTESYLAPEQKCALIKLHGSINWGRKVLNPPSKLESTDPYLAATVAGLNDTIELSDDIELRLSHDIETMRRNNQPFRRSSEPIQLYYPALSVPLGPRDDELVCPPAHVNYLKEVTGDPDPLDVLVIGYSGLDQEVLNLLKWGGRPIRSLAVVSETQENAALTARRFVSQVVVAPKGDIRHIGGGFAKFARDGSLDNYVQMISTRT